MLVPAAYGPAVQRVRSTYNADACPAFQLQLTSVWRLQRALYGLAVLPSAWLGYLWSGNDTSSAQSPCGRRINGTAAKQRAQQHRTL